MIDELIPVHPEPPTGEQRYPLYAVTWIAQNGSEQTCLFGATDPVEAARIALNMDPMLRRYSNHASIDVRECLPVQTFKPEITV